MVLTGNEVLHVTSVVCKIGVMPLKRIPSFALVRTTGLGVVILMLVCCEYSTYTFQLHSAHLCPHVENLWIGLCIHIYISISI